MWRYANVIANNKMALYSYRVPFSLIIKGLTHTHTHIFVQDTKSRRPSNVWLWTLLYGFDFTPMHSESCLAPLSYEALAYRWYDNQASHLRQWEMRATLMSTKSSHCTGNVSHLYSPAHYHPQFISLMHAYSQGSRRSNPAVAVMDYSENAYKFSW